MLDHRTHVQGGGRLVIPVDYRKAMGLEIGDEVMLRMKDNELCIYPAREALKRVRQLVRKYSPTKHMVDDLIAERRRESKNE